MASKAEAGGRNRNQVSLSKDIAGAFVGAFVIVEIVYFFVSVFVGSDSLK